MVPLINIGNELKIQIVDKNEKFNRFDILIFKSELGFTCHYYWKTNRNLDKGLIITRNLKNGNYDIPFHRDLVIGIVKNYKIGILMKLKILMKDWLNI
jgi:hypothetical protein